MKYKHIDANLQNAIILPWKRKCSYNQKTITHNMLPYTDFDLEYEQISVGEKIIRKQSAITNIDEYRNDLVVYCERAYIC